VIGIDKNHLELLRYYILERVEEVGRLALEVKGEYPLLFTLERLPKELQRIVIVGKEDTKGYSLEPKIKKEEGDKIEHVEFDKAERHFQSEPDKEAENWYNELINSLRTELEKRGLTAETILTREAAQRINEYKVLAKALNIRATGNQQDVYGLMQFIMEKLAVMKK
jgi:phosphoglycerate-specific signal transduction histidine kinase